MSFAAVLERLTNLENPYPGLRPFQTAEAHLFFGRDQQVLDLLDRLARNRFVAVLGLSGSGKSSLVYAGLIPALSRGTTLEPGLRWRFATAKPRGAPFAHLAESLGCDAQELRTSSHGLIEYARRELSPDEGLFVLIDQFEELFRYKERDPSSPRDSAGFAAAASEAGAFIELLLAATRGPLPVYVLITMRTDYLGDCAKFPDFPEALNDSQYLVPRLTRQQRRQAIEGPLGRVRISSALVERILNDAGDEPDQLPILQHVLMRTWSQWQKSPTEGGKTRAEGSEAVGRLRVIDADDYRRAGGFKGALNQHADELLRNPIVKENPAIVETIFRRLTALGRGNRERREPATLAELWAICASRTPEDRAQVMDVIDCFRHGEATFLVPRAGLLTPEQYVDITHESLIRGWNRLRDEWLPDEQKLAETFLDLLDRARNQEKRRGELLRGLDLDNAMDWERRRNKSEAWGQHYADESAIRSVLKFIRSSVVARDMELRFESERNQRDRAREEQLRVAAESLKRAKTDATLQALRVGILIAGVLLVLFLALRQDRFVKSQASVRTSETLLYGGDRGQALKFAIGAYRRTPTREAREAVSNASAQLLAQLEGHVRWVTNAVFSPDGQSIVTASDDHTARIWSTATGRLLAKLEGHTSRVNSVAFSPDSHWIVTASDDHTARIWNAAAGKLLATLEGHSEAVNSVTFSPDATRIVTASDDRSIRIWNAVTGQPLDELEGHSRRVNCAVFSPDSQRIVTASDDQTAQIWDVSRGILAKLEGHAGSVINAVFSPDGQRIVTASDDHTARIWNAFTGELLSKLEGHADAVNSAQFSPDGQRIVTASNDHSARIWNSATGHLLAKLEGHTGRINNAAFSPDGRQIVTASDDYTARIWDVGSAGALARLQGHTGRVVNAAFSPDSQRVVTASEDHTARLWNGVTGEVTEQLTGHVSRLNSAVFSPDGQRIVTASSDHTARIWNAVTGEFVAKLLHADKVNSAVFSLDGRRIVTASDDHTARVWTTETGQLVAELHGHFDTVNQAAFSPNGRQVVTASDDHTARIWNSATGQLLATLEGHSNWVKNAAFSPNGRQVVTASDDHTARIWNSATGQLLATLEGHSNWVKNAAFSPDGERILTVSRDHTVRIWDAASGQPLVKLTDRAGFNNAAFSPSAQGIVTASDDYTASIWDATSGVLRAKLEGHAGPVLNALFSPDGLQIVTASADATARVWNASNGRVIGKLEGHRGAVNSAVFSPDGRYVVTGSEDKTAQVFGIVTLGDIARLLAAK